MHSIIGATAKSSASAGSPEQGGVNWKMVLAIGAPAALGAGIIGYFLYRRSISGEKSTWLELESAGTSGTSTPAGAQSARDQAVALKEKGNKYFRGRKYDSAIEVYTSAISICPKESRDDLAAIYQNRAAAHENLKNYQAVIEDCTEALKLNPTYSKALNRRAKAYKEQNQWDMCLEDATASALLEKFNNSVTLQLADEALKHLGAAQAQIEFQKRKPQLPSKNFIKAYITSFINDPTVVPPRSDSAAAGDASRPRSLNESEDEENNASLNNGDYEKVQMTDSTLAAGAASSDSSPYEQAKMLVNQGVYDQIVDLCTKELENPSSASIPESLILRSTFYMLSGVSDKATQDLERVTRMENISARLLANALIKRATLKINLSDTDGALADLSQAEKADPDNCDVYNHRGQLYLLLNNLEAAISDLEKCTTLNPDFVIGHVQKAYAEYKMVVSKQQLLGFPLPHDAQKQFESLIERFPNSVEANALCAQALVDTRQFDRADELFDKCVRIDPTNASLYVHKGMLLLQWKNDIPGSIEFLNKAIETDPKCEFALETLGTLEMQRGNTEAARQVFVKAMKLSKTEQDMGHLCSMICACEVQSRVAKKMGLESFPVMPTQQMQELIASGAAGFQ